MSTPMLQVGKLKISTFLYIKTFIISIGLFIGYFVTYMLIHVYI